MNGPTRSPGGTAQDRVVVFYDGHCGFCHWAVTFLAARDRRHAFDYAPLDGETFERVVPAGARADLGDSLIAALPDGTLLQRSRALAALLRRLPAAWPVAGLLLRLVPAPLADAAYDAFARRRHRLVEAPTQGCPIVPEDLRGRFLP